MSVEAYMKLVGGWGASGETGADARADKEMEDSIASPVVPFAAPFIPAAPAPERVVASQPLSSAAVIVAEAGSGISWNTWGSCTLAEAPPADKATMFPPQQQCHDQLQLAVAAAPPPAVKLGPRRPYHPPPPTTSAAPSSVFKDDGGAPQAAAAVARTAAAAAAALVSNNEDVVEELMSMLQMAV
jgi:hypothetical protein